MISTHRTRRKTENAKGGDWGGGGGKGGGCSGVRGSCDGKVEREEKIRQKLDE